MDKRYPQARRWSYDFSPPREEWSSRRRSCRQDYVRGWTTAVCEIDAQPVRGPSHPDGWQNGFLPQLASGLSYLLTPWVWLDSRSRHHKFVPYRTHFPEESRFWHRA